jgi:hypothetical protein
MFRRLRRNNLEMTLYLLKKRPAVLRDALQTQIQMEDRKRRVF